MATVAAITYVRGACLGIILLIRCRRRSPDKPQPARPLLDNTPEGILADTWITKGGAEQSRRAAFGPRARTRLGRPPTGDPGRVQYGVAPVCTGQVQT